MGASGDDKRWGGASTREWRRDYRRRQGRGAGKGNHLRSPDLDQVAVAQESALARRRWSLTKIPFRLPRSLITILPPIGSMTACLRLMA